MKEQIKKLTSFLLTPWRRRYQKRNGTTSNQPRHELPNEEWLGEVSQMLKEGKPYAIYVKGYSMRPFIEHTRDRVFLEKRDTYNVGDAVLAQIAPGHYVLHRIIEKRGDDLTLQGDGNLKGVELCKEQDVSGVVTQYIRPRRIIPADDPKLIRRIKLWRKLRPVRRFLLFIYNAIR
ncbi:MAG: S24/S26 family peptidase [Bacteroidaceae bacterium]|nr:S24/S26 family peptidase [Bacteroidaceae bacterium]MBQ9170857.1 S24/S26 family peptidase [Bacteroidaceae bacterium]MBQ9293851.1 S24/S26 family peptidase [Bacteroidaceae bacterium]